MVITIYVDIYIAMLYKYMATYIHMHLFVVSHVANNKVNRLVLTTPVMLFYTFLISQKTKDTN